MSEEMSDEPPPSTPVLYPTKDGSSYFPEGDSAPMCLVMENLTQRITHKRKRGEEVYTEQRAKNYRFMSDENGQELPISTRMDPAGVEREYFYDPHYGLMLHDDKKNGWYCFKTSRPVETWCYWGWCYRTHRFDIYKWSRSQKGWLMRFDTEQESTYKNNDGDENVYRETDDEEEVWHYNSQSSIVNSSANYTEIFLNDTSVSASASASQMSYVPESDGDEPYPRTSPCAMG